MNVLYAKFTTGPRGICASSYQYNSNTKAEKGERI